MKKMTLAILALVLVTVTTAFTWRNDDAKKEVTTAYFQYLGTDPEDDENDPSNWVKVEDPENLCPVGYTLLCTIQAPIADPEDTHPDFTNIPNVRNSSSINIMAYKP